MILRNQKFRKIGNLANESAMGLEDKSNFKRSSAIGSTAVVTDARTTAYKKYSQDLEEIRRQFKSMSVDQVKQLVQSIKKR